MAKTDGLREERRGVLGLLRVCAPNCRETERAAGARYACQAVEASRTGARRDQRSYGM